MQYLNKILRVLYFAPFHNQFNPWSRNLPNSIQISISIILTWCVICHLHTVLVLFYVYQSSKYITTNIKLSNIIQTLFKILLYFSWLLLLTIFNRIPYQSNRNNKCLKYSRMLPCSILFNRMVLNTLVFHSVFKFRHQS